MNSLTHFEPATPAMIVGKAFGDSSPPLGLGEPFALLGGDRLGPNGIPFLLMHEHQPAFLQWVAQTCRKLLQAERPWFRAELLLLTGPQGAGRTHAARWLARCAGVPHVVLNLTDPVMAANLAASSQVSEALWASPITVAMAATACANPIVTVVGADKVSDDVAAGLASMIDPELGTAWSEDQLGVQIDLGEVSWILQCDRPEAVSGVIRERASLVRLAPAPMGTDTVLALSVLLEAMGDLGLDPADRAYGWSRIKKHLSINYRPSTKQLYAEWVSAIRKLLREAVPALDPSKINDEPF